MTNKNPNGPRESGKTKRVAKPAAPLGPKHTSIDVERSGDWMPAEDLRGAVLAALDSGNDISINLDKIHHLDASALQILLAVDAEQKRRGRRFHLANASSQLRKWLTFAGADDCFLQQLMEAHE